MTTDHIKIWTNNSQFLGLVVKPFSYRVNFAPDFYPRFSVGDMRGLDQARWRSWVQARFDEGEGQMLWSSAEATNRYAQGHLVEVGRPDVTSRAEGTNQQYGHNLVNYGVAGSRDDSVVGDISTALYPMATSQGIYQVMFNTKVGNPASLFTDKFPTFVLEWSGRPSIWHWKSAWWYTNVYDPISWSGAALEAYSNRLTGKWQQLWSHSDQADDFWINDAVNYSGTIHLAIKETRGVHRMLAYGPMAGTQAVNTSEIHFKPTISTMYSPVYATIAAKLAVYDEKLWFSKEGSIHYLEPAASTMPARWESLLPGSPSDEVLNMREFNGRLYIGKPNALWTFDAGRLYRVEDFSSYHDHLNFSHMTVHRGYMYFNIKHMLFRLSTAGTLEQIQTYSQGGIIADAASVGDRLYYLTRSPGIQDPAATVWVFDPETGGNFKMFSSYNVGMKNWRSPRSMGTAYGLLFMSPMTQTEQYNATGQSQGYTINMPISVLDPVVPATQKHIAHFATRDSWFITSMLDFGLPTLQKSFKRLTVDYELQGRTQDYIKVYYITGLERPRTLTNSFEAKTLDAAPAWPATKDDKLIDGDISTGRAFVFGPGEHDFWVVAAAAPDGAIAGGTAIRDDITTLRFISKWNAAGGERFPDGDFKMYAYTDGAWVNISNACSFEVSYMSGFYGGDIQYLVIEVLFRWNRIPMTHATTGTVTEAALTDTRGLQNWWALKTVNSFTEFEAREVFVASPADEPVHINNLNWTYLGQIGGYADPSTSEVHKTRKSLSFPNGFAADQLMLKFMFYGSKFTKPIIRRYEVEWMPTPTKLKVYNFTVPVAENVELPNLQVRSNATSVVATLYSFAAAGRSYVCQLPWPGEHTINAMVSITPPGGSVPSLRDDDINNSHSEIPVQLDEV